MFSSDKNIESVAALVEELKKHLTLRTEMAKLDVVDKSVRIITALSLIFIVVLLALAMTIYLSFAVAYALGASVLSLPAAFFVVACIYLLVIVIVVSFRKSLIERPLVRLFSSILFN